MSPVVCLFRSPPRNDLATGMKHIDRFDNRLPYTPCRISEQAFDDAIVFSRVVNLKEKCDAGDLWDVLRSND